MSKSTTRRNASPGNRVGTYFRFSTETQDKSIERQQSEVNPYVKAKGYRVIESAQDEAITGSEVAKRKGLQRIISLALTGAIDGIVVDDLDRFLRLDLLELGELLSPLRRAGVWLESVAQGRFDYNSYSGRITLGVSSEAKHEQLIDTARRCLTMHLHMARDKGEPPLPKPAFGYRRIDDPNKPRRKDGKRPGMFIIHEPEAIIVRQIAEWFDNGKPAFWICREMERRGILSPGGSRRWRKSTVREMMSNPIYLGQVAWGKSRQGKYFRVNNGKVSQGERSRRKDVRPRAEWFIQEDRVPAIITDRDLWARMQARIERGKKRDVMDENGNKLRQEGEASTPGSEPGEFILNRLLVCAKCKGWMTGLTVKRKEDKIGYLCSHYVDAGINACIRCEVKENEAIRAIVKQLRDLLSSDRQAQLRAQLTAHLQATRSTDNLSRLRKQAQELQGRLNRYKKRLLEVSEDMIPEVEEGIRNTRQELEATNAELGAAEAIDPVQELEKTVSAASKALWNLESALEGSDRLQLRQALRGIIGSIWVHPEAHKSRAGKVHFRPGLLEVELLRGTGLELLSNVDACRRGCVHVRYPEA